MKKSIIAIVVCLAFAFGFAYSPAPADAAGIFKGHSKGWAGHVKKGGKLKGQSVEPAAAPLAAPSVAVQAAALAEPGISAQAVPLSAGIVPDVVVKADPANMVSGYLADLDYVQMEWASRVGAEGERILPRVKSGQIVQIDTINIVGLTRGNIEGNKALLTGWGVDPESEIGQTIINVAEHLTGGHVLTGPVYIEEAEPGDVLEVRILDLILPVPYGRCQQRPGAGAIPDLTPENYVKVVKMDIEKDMVLFDENIQFKTRPMMGIMGVAPPKGWTPGSREQYGYTASSPPGPFAGNLDLWHLTRGATLYIPVFHEGALFYTGDAHGSQGNGEVTVNGIEMSLTGVFQFIVHKRDKLTGFMVDLSRPFAENKTHYIPIGLGAREARDLNSAMVDATLQTIRFLEKEKGMSWQEAFALASLRIDFEVTQVVDSTLGIHSMIEKSIWIHENKEYWYDHLDLLGACDCLESAMVKFNAGKCITKADGTPLFPAACAAREAELKVCTDACDAYKNLIIGGGL